MFSSCTWMLFRPVSYLFLVIAGIAAFNLDVEKPTVYSGPEGSYFGYSVDFHKPVPNRNTMSILVGAPKANTSQPGIVEGGAVYYCPWPATDSDRCRQIPFDMSNNRMVRLNGSRIPIEFKSNQWFGATVRTHKGKVVACAPLYHWRTRKQDSEKDPVGTCYVANQNFSTYAEYSPCRSSNPDPEGQGFCQAGFSVDFTKDGNLVVGGPGSYYWQGQVITTSVAEIINGFSFKEILRKVKGEKQTRAAPDSYDDSYLGYSVAVGEFTGDSEQELIAGVPRGAHNFGYVAVINSSDLTFIQNFTGEQMASYFGYTMAVSDLNGDGLDDILVGAPLYMDREFESKPKEVGRVYIYLQEDALFFKDAIILSGTEVFGRFGSSIASLGDINLDGYHDIAVGAPFAGEDRRGRVFIYNGQQDGLKLPPSQVLEGAWTSQSIPAGFGFTLRGDSDVDQNEYPDLIVGAFGAGKAVVYRARPVVTVAAQLLLNRVILNPENKTCQVPNSETSVTCLTVRVCATVSGRGIPDSVALNTELHLDRLKQKGAIKRILFLENAQYQYTFQLLVEKRKPQACQNFVVYLKDETEFRDKLTPISIGLNYSLDESNPPGGLTLKPILNYYGKPFIHEQVYILVDCGEDNVCIPDLKLSARMDREQLIIGEENPLMLTINAQNQGEGAYESELHVLIPQEADYIGVERKNEALRQLSCEYRMENVTRMVVCDLGNPMVAGTNLSVGLRFAVQRLEEAGSDIKFDLQIKSSNKDNPRSNPISLQINITAVARVEIRGVSHPAQIFLPIHQWEPKDKPEKEQDIGPSVQHIYELHNKGPSAISNTFLEVGWPSHFKDEYLLYVLEVQTDRLINCRTNTTINQLNLETSALPDTPELLGFLRNSTTVHSVRKREVIVPEPLRQYNAKTLNCSNVSCLRMACHVVRLDKGQSAVVTVKARLWAHTFLQRKNDPYSLHSTVSFKVMDMPYRIKPERLPHASLAIKTLVLWATPDVSFAIPLWVIILAILLGLLVLAILTLVMWKCGFFDRARPPKDDISDQEQLTSEKSTDP
ncbi:integrin alpha-8-like [Polyodon spathula]|uniref:integrin alpha-8-like n=1 Tax=Polyodon spathula TaxID=7913 RepID=UPI001B7F555E|nr:integrin alpha-8-like [Polyodon spathula]